MKDSLLYYSVGALLYCPANRETIANSIISERFGTKYSLALCLEDTIKDDCVKEAEQKLIQALQYVYQNKQTTDFYIPKIFIRVRCPEQIPVLYSALADAASLLTGFIIPKFAPDNADAYIQEIVNINQNTSQKVYMMPIFENPIIINLQERSNILYTLKAKLDAVEEYVLNIRVGGNDLCHAFGFRRHSTETIHDIRPISNIFADIITVFGRDYVISGPVWEYYNGDNWKQGLQEELKKDMLCGFLGKTAIHPHQVDVINEAYKVDRNDYEDAKAVCNWREDGNQLVSGGAGNERMNEYKTHYHWARRILFLAEYYGIKE